MQRSSTRAFRLSQNGREEQNCFLANRRSKAKGLPPRNGVRLLKRTGPKCLSLTTKNIWCRFCCRSSQCLPPSILLLSGSFIDGKPASSVMYHMMPYLPAVSVKRLSQLLLCFDTLLTGTQIAANRGFRQVSKSYNDNVGKLVDGKKDTTTAAIKHSNVFVCDNFRKDNFSLLWKMQSLTAEKEKQAPDATATDMQPESQARVDAVQSTSPSEQKEPGKTETPIEMDRDSSERDDWAEEKPARKRHRNHTDPSSTGSETKRPNIHLEAGNTSRAESQSSQELNLANSRVAITSPRADSAPANSKSYQTGENTRAEISIAQLQPGNRSMLRPPDQVVATGCAPSSVTSLYNGREAQLQAMNASAITESNPAASVSTLLARSALSHSTQVAAPNFPNLSLLPQTDHQMLIRAQQIAQIDQLLRAQQMPQPQMQAPLPLSLISQYPVGLHGHHVPPALVMTPNLGVVDLVLRDMSIRHASSDQILPLATLYQQLARLLSTPAAPTQPIVSQQAQMELLHQNNALLQRLLSRIQETPQNQGESHGHER
jgi:hypothetical protein